MNHGGVSFLLSGSIGWLKNTMVGERMRCNLSKVSKFYTLPVCKQTLAVRADKEETRYREKSMVYIVKGKGV